MASSYSVDHAASRTVAVSGECGGNLTPGQCSLKNRFKACCGIHRFVW